MEKARAQAEKVHREKPKTCHILQPLQGYLAHKKTPTSPGPPGTLDIGIRYSCRVLGVCIFLTVRYPCRALCVSLPSGLKAVAAYSWRVTPAQGYLAPEKTPTP